MMYEALALLAVFVLIYSSVGGGVGRTLITGPIVFTAFGLLVGPLGLELFSLGLDHETIRLLAELTLALPNLFVMPAEAGIQETLHFGEQ